MKICTGVVCTWSIKFKHKFQESCVASAPAGKLDSTLRRLKNRYEGFELTELRYFKTFIYKY